VNHSALKNEINLQATTTHDQRHDATRLFIKGRKLRREGRALGAEGNGGPDPEKGVQLLKQGWQAHQDAEYLIMTGEDTRCDRRHLHLAAAMLNGRTYLRCERSYNEQATDKPGYRTIRFHIEDFLPSEDKALANVLAQAWLDNGNVRLKYDRETDRVQLVAVDAPLIEQAEAA